MPLAPAEPERTAPKDARHGLLLRRLHRSVRLVRLPYFTLLQLTGIEMWPMFGPGSILPRDLGENLR